MPYKHENKTIPSEYDKRRKLTERQKKMIRLEYDLTLISQRELAKKYNVSRKLIQFILDPEKLKRSKELYKERRKDGRYYKKELHTKQMRDHRRYKQDLYLNNKLDDREEK